MTEPEPVQPSGSRGRLPLYVVVVVVVLLMGGAIGWLVASNTRADDGMRDDQLDVIIRELISTTPVDEPADLGNPLKVLPR